jgi:hypothetical protein
MSRDLKCAHCARLFFWGADGDSGLDGIPANCAENAYWKLVAHMRLEHPDGFFECPRQGENFRGGMPEAFWRDDGTCSYCGSLRPETLLEAIEAGSVELGATDKNYKLYVEGLPDPNAGKPTIYASASHDPGRDGWILLTSEKAEELGLDSYGRTQYVGRYVQVEPTRATRHDEFYFQHFDERQMRRFVELYNADRMRFLDYRDGESVIVPRGFYRLPFFMARERAA